MARSGASLTRGGITRHGQSPIASVSTSAAPLPTSCCSAPTAAIHTKKVSSSVENYAQAIVDGLSEVFRETGLDRRGHRGNPPRHHGRLERDPGAQGRARRADHHQGLPRRARNPHPADAEALRPRLDQARTAGRALSAPGGGRAHRSSRAGRARARSGRRRARGRRAARRKGRGDRRVPDQLVHQSGARADAQGHHRPQGPSPAP